MKIWKIAQGLTSIPEHKPGLSGAREREARLYKAIEEFAKDNNIGEIEPIHIDARGEILMVQKLKPADFVNIAGYVNPDPINPKILDIARQYGLIGNRSGSRWMCMGHFAWEKMLGEMGYFARATPEELSKDIGFA